MLLIKDNKLRYSADHIILLEHAHASYKPTSRWYQSIGYRQAMTLPTTTKIDDYRRFWSNWS
jgi:hypothetical protein